jgi:threonine dehydrogenase-like Zn-dependent dehydrogenase
LTITTGLVDTRSTPTLVDLVASHQLDATPMITHRFAMDDLRCLDEVNRGDQVLPALRPPTGCPHRLARRHGRPGRAQGLVLAGQHDAEERRVVGEMPTLVVG